jgi:hypothetical protein
MKIRLFALASVAALSFASNAYAKQDEAGSLELTDKIISVGGSGYHRSFPCNGRKLEVAGTGHVITTTGECSHVDVSGAGNTVAVAVAPKGSLEVSGANQTIQWKSSGEIKQDISGTGHKITRLK